MTEAGEQSAIPTSETAPSPRRCKARRWLRVVVYVLLFVLVPCELSTRAYFAIRGQSSFWWPDLQSVFYRELRQSKVLDAPQSRSDGFFDVLLLGGSVIAPEFAQIDENLGRRLERDIGRPVKIYNLAQAGHSSRDSLNKYLRLAQKRFDLVLFYHAINESRMNNSPPDMFRDDYTHASWYARIAALQKHPEAPAITLPYALHFFWIKLGEKTGLTAYLPKHKPPDSWLDYGANIRSERAFRANVNRLIEEANKRGDRLALITFAIYLPKHYDFDKPHDQQPEGVNDYVRDRTSLVEMWGRARHVVAAVTKHNDALRQLARSARTSSKVIFVDLDATLPRRGEFFEDITHFSLAGQQVFVDSVASTIAARISGGDKD